MRWASAALDRSSQASNMAGIGSLMEFRRPSVPHLFKNAPEIGFRTDDIVL